MSGSKRSPSLPSRFSSSVWNLYPDTFTVSNFKTPRPMNMFHLSKPGVSGPEIDVMKVQSGHGHVCLVLLEVGVIVGGCQLNGTVCDGGLLVQETPRHGERSKAP